MTRHLASKKAKQVLTGYDIVNIPIPTILCLIPLALGVLNYVTPNIGITYLYTGILMSGLIYFSILLLMKKRIKPNREFVGIIGLNILWCLGCGWWGFMIFWIMLSIDALLLMHNYDKQ